MRILLTMPRYSPECALGASIAFQQPSLAHQVTAISPMGSLLPDVFNAGWEMALNAWEAGECDAFAMIHSDVEAGPLWLDVLVEEMELVQAGAIAAIVPIKDERGLTSTAVDDTGDPYRPRRLTMTEVEQLPETFTSRDVPELLLNTGLWVVKLGDWLSYEDTRTVRAIAPCFEIQSTLRRESDGRWHRRTVSEDWDFSRQMRARGLMLAATRKVPVQHWGPYRWSNRHVYGWDTDRVNAREQAQGALTSPVEASS